MKRIPHLFPAICLLAAAAACAGAEPSGKGNDPAPAVPATISAPSEDIALVKGFVVTGALTKVIGHFTTHGRPSVGNTFEIDLKNLPRERLDFTRTATDPLGQAGPHPSYIPFSAPLMIEQVRRQSPGTKPGRAAIHLSASDGSGKFLIQVLADTLEKGSKVRILFYQSGNFIGSMAEGEGVLK